MEAIEPLFSATPATPGSSAPIDEELADLPDITDPARPTRFISSKRCNSVDRDSMIAVVLSIACHTLIVVLGFSVWDRPAPRAATFLMAGAPEIRSDQTAGSSAVHWARPDPEEVSSVVPPIDIAMPDAEAPPAPEIQHRLEMPPPLPSAVSEASVQIPQTLTMDKAPELLGVGAQTFATPGKGMFHPPRAQQSVAPPGTGHPAPAAPVTAGAPRNYSPPSVAKGVGNRGIRNGLDGRGIPIPDYPPDSRRRREQGVVELDLEILPDGTVGNVQVISDPGFPQLVKAAIAAAKLANFNPALEDGQKITGHIIVPFRFTLD